MNDACNNAAELHFVIIADNRTDQIHSDHLMAKDTASFRNCMHSYENRSRDAESNGTSASFCLRHISYLLGRVMNNPWNTDPEGFS